MKKMLLNTTFLTAGMPMMGVVLFLLGSWVLSRIYHGNIPDMLFVVLFEISDIFILIGCYIMIKRREVARFGLPSIKGVKAVISGVFSFIVWTAIGVGLAYFYLVK